MDVYKLFDNKSSIEICKEIENIAKSIEENSISDLIDLLLTKYDDMYIKFDIPRLVCRGLILKGKSGIERIVSKFEEVESSIYSNAILESLWLAKEGVHAKLMVIKLEEDSHLNNQIDLPTSEFAKTAIHDMVVESQSNPEIFYRFVNFFYMSTVKSMFDEEQNKSFQKDFFSVLSDSTIKITSRNINELKNLVEAQCSEEEYQVFFERHPVFLNPLGSKIVDKHRLGDDYITDFVLETLQSDYLIVEIEKPTDRIFTKNYEFTSNFIHAFGQVIDFINWIETNISYAEKKLPGIVSPRGLLVIGRSNKFSKREEDRLRRFNKNSKSIEVITYDDIILRAESLYRNIKG